MIPKGVIFALSLMLVIGIFPMPYGYYSLLRICTFGIMGLLAYDTYSTGHKVLPWVFGFMAILFNPIIKIHLPKEAWAAIDFISALILIATVKQTCPEVKHTK